MTSGVPALENTPEPVVFHQECLTGQIVMEPMHCGFHKENGGLEKRATLEQPQQLWGGNNSF